MGDERRMADLARRAAEEGLSVRAVEEVVRRTRGKGAGGPTEKGARGTDPHVRRVEVELQRRLGTEVRIRVTRGVSGRVEIPFYDSEDFERLMELLLGGATDVL